MVVSRDRAKMPSADDGGSARPQERSTSTADESARLQGRATSVADGSARLQEPPTSTVDKSARSRESPTSLEVAPRDRAEGPSGVVGSAARSRDSKTTDVGHAMQRPRRRTSDVGHPLRRRSFIASHVGHSTRRHKSPTSPVDGRARTPAGLTSADGSVRQAVELAPQLTHPRVGLLAIAVQVRGPKPKLSTVTRVTAATGHPSTTVVSQCGPGPRSISRRGSLARLTLSRPQDSR